MQGAPGILEDVELAKVWFFQQGTMPLPDPRGQDHPRADSLYSLCRLAKCPRSAALVACNPDGNGGRVSRGELGSIQSTAQALKKSGLLDRLRSTGVPKETPLGAGCPGEEPPRLLRGQPPVQTRRSALRRVCP